MPQAVNFEVFLFYKVKILFRKKPEDSMFSKDWKVLSVAMRRIFQFDALSAGTAWQFGLRTEWRKRSLDPQHFTRCEGLRSCVSPRGPGW